MLDTTFPLSNYETLRLPKEFGDLICLEELLINNLYLNELPESFGNLVNLKTLDIGCNPNIKKLPASFTSGLTSLECLNVSSCDIREEGLLNDIADLLALEVLDLSSNTFCTLPESFSKTPKLTTLSMRGCRELVELPTLSDGLIHLDVRKCSQLQRISRMSHMKKLKDLNLSGCTRLTELPELKSLESLALLELNDCKSLEELPTLPEGLVEAKMRCCLQLKRISHMSHLKRLGVLDVSDCEKLIELPGLGFLTSLKELHLNGCKNLQCVAGELLCLQHLELCANRVPPLSSWDFKAIDDRQSLEYKLEKDAQCRGVVFCVVLGKGSLGGTVMTRMMTSAEAKVVSRDFKIPWRRIKEDELHLYIYREDQHSSIIKFHSGDMINCCFADNDTGSCVCIKEAAIHLLQEKQENGATAYAEIPDGRDLSLLNEDGETALPKHVPKPPNLSNEDYTGIENEFQRSHEMDSPPLPRKRPRTNE
eukprot:Gb_16616 [translate_table: standard]